MGVRWRMAAAHEMQGTTGSWGRHIRASQEGIRSPGRRSLRQAWRSSPAIAELVADHLRTSPGRKSPSWALAGVRRPGGARGQPAPRPPLSEVSELGTVGARGRPTATVPHPGRRSPRPALAVGRRALPWPEVAELGAGRTRAFAGGRGWRARWEAGGRTAATDACGGSFDGKQQARGHRCVQRRSGWWGLGGKIEGSRNRRCNLWRSFL
jgi:hypothetical protein